MKKFIVPAPQLLAVLKKAKEVVVKHPTLQILDNVLIKVRRTDIQVYATDMMVTLQGTIDITNDGDFSYDMLIPFDFLYKVCQLVNVEPLEFEYSHGDKKVANIRQAHRYVVITSYEDKYNLEELDDPKDYPALPEFPDQNSVGISGDFIDWLNRAILTASKDSSRPAMEKIYIGIDKKRITMASTDANSLMEKTFEASSVNTAELLVNTKIAKALKGFNNTTISWSKTHIAFVSDGITLIGTIQDEKFPKYKDVFPISAEANMTVSHTELTGVMEKMSLTGKEAIIYLKREIGLVVVESTDVDYNRKVRVRMAADFGGDTEKIAVDPGKVLNMLKQVEYATLNLSITGINRPIVITTDSDNSYRALVMPMMVHEK